VSRLLAFSAGLVFAVGLGVAGMTRPEKVIGFLDFFGRWDPSLALVMVGAIGVHLTFLRVTRRWAKPVCAASFPTSAPHGIDRRLILGAALFGIGWGLAGYCPGPAIASLVAGPNVAVLVLAMLIGVLLYEVQQRLVGRSEQRDAASADPAE
jgi:uncharacterized membrane protein YedE/YeeE